MLPLRPAGPGWPARRGERRAGCQAPPAPPLPNRRLRAVGADATRAEYARWFAAPGHFDELRRYSVDGGEAEVIEYTLSWSEHGVPHAAHHLHLLTVHDDRIVADMAFAGG